MVKKRDNKVFNTLDNQRYDEYIHTDKKVSLYYPNWSIYGRGYFPKHLPLNNNAVPDIMYSFFDIDQKGNVKSMDAFADFDKRFTTINESVDPPDTWANNDGYYGCFGQFLKLKKQGKKFNLILAIGGWSSSKYFSSAVLPENRLNFINNLIQLFDKYPIFSGVSLDWEYPSSDGKNHGNQGNESRSSDALNFKLFLQLLRQTLDSSSNKSHYIISICCSGDPSMVSNMKAKELEPYIDEFQIMTYDYQYGSSIATHHTNLYKSNITPFSVDTSVYAYINGGIPPSKIMIGVAYYSRGFICENGLGTKVLGNSTDKSWEDGVVDYKDLPKPNAIEYWDPVSKAPYTYDSTKKNFNSYDNVNSVYEKCKFIWEKGLKGCIIWDVTGDSSDSRSLTKALYNYLYVTDIANIKAPDQKLKVRSNGVEIKPIAPVRNDIPVSPPTTPTPIPVSPEPIIVPEPITPPNTNVGGIKQWTYPCLYKKNDIVKYQDKFYSCLIDHNTNITWTPELTEGVLWVVNKNIVIPIRPTPSVPAPIIPIPNPPPITPVPNIPVPSVPDCICNKKIKSIKILKNLELSDIEITYI